MSALADAGGHLDRVPRRRTDRPGPARQRVLVAGATGMLGHTLLRELSADPTLDVHGTARDLADRAPHFPAPLVGRIASDIDASRFDQVRRIVDELRPDVVVNCVGVIKQRPDVQDATHTVTLNALFPHMLAQTCGQIGSRLVHVSTDCVFSGRQGGYVEEDLPDPPDLYGRSKLLGEVTGEGTLTLRTSIIGHELTSNRSLVDWFLSRPGGVKGWTRAIYTGVTTVEFARLLRTVVLPRTDLTGLYHLAAEPISKYDLLRLIAEVYRWPGDIVPDDGFACDRSMRADRLADVTGYRPPSWPEMVRSLYAARARWAGAPAEVDRRHLVV
ncbi:MULTISPECIES: SDR family oxidoreductase [unclassified Solwaraspora]|uniref:dTDP-4-dehydrorhamnose reductase family protein n=1 Tax=unclassified Solwaraspora TaxID=2627926 RepID=UPI00248C5183|nr:MULTISPECIES: SDR family oxidoreductase [unclassified Solwaraspora]WBC21554.1 SDR family oxidoreductase [Solwaraspora sp. WMMA2080]WJK36409.1 SDR family oxidoreductase [Solwaraspora sp. WMMA2065]